MTIRVQVGDVVRVQKRCSVSPYFAEAAVHRAEPPCDRVLLQNRCNGTSQRMSGEILDPSAGFVQRIQGLLVPSAVAHHMQRDQRIVDHVPGSGSACNIHIFTMPNSDRWNCCTWVDVRCRMQC